MLRLLDELETVGGGAKSLYIPSGLPLAEVKDLIGKVIDEQDMPPDLAELTVNSKTGAVLFWGLSRRCLVLPPFPIGDKHLTYGYDIGTLQRILKRDFTVALILVRLGAYAIGIANGEKLITSKVGTGLVHARHKKGGSSQGRFARHREKQIEQFLVRVCCRVREQLEPHVKAIDYMVYGGAKTTIRLLQKQCPFLGHFDDRILRLLLDIPQPREEVLKIALGDIWSSRVTEWHDAEG